MGDWQPGVAVGQTLEMRAISQITSPGSRMFSALTGDFVVIVCCSLYILLDKMSHDLWWLHMGLAELACHAGGHL